MNPLHWKREHRIAFFGAAVFGACIGVFAGMRQAEQSDGGNWLIVALWGVLGAVMGAAGAFIRQWMRDRFSK